MIVTNIQEVINHIGFVPDISEFIRISDLIAIRQLNGLF